MNALNDPQGRGRSASSPEFRKHAGMVVRSDRGDKKHREGFFLAVECMQSHLLKVNCHEMHRGQWGHCLKARIHIQVESKSDSQRQCSASISLLVTCTLSMTSS